jgi:acyl-CoA synthetase (AMP-forming)/AMP-acid ligase II
VNIIDFFDHSPGHFNHTEAFVEAESGISYSYSEISSLTHKLAHVLADAGIKPGDRVAVYSPNCVMAYCCLLAIFRVGAVWLPVNAKNHISENIKIIKRAGVRLLFLHNDFAEHWPEIRREAPLIERVIGVDGATDFALGVEDVVKTMDEAGDYPALEEDHLRATTLLSTGGTTGEPKLAEWSARTWEGMAANQLTCMPCDSPPIYLVAAPMTHAAGVSSFPVMLQGATLVVLKDAKPENVMKAIERYKVTHLFLPPTVIYVMLAHPDVTRYDYSSLKYFWYAAAPMSVEKLKQALDIFGPVMAQTYGQAEAPMMCTYFSPREHVDALANGREERLASCGRASPFVSVAIMDDAGELLPVGEKGEIVVRGSLVTTGYYENPMATAEVRKNGWHCTGDIGYRDEDGYIYIVDRKKDMIISGGFNVFPGEIEQHLWSHPDIQDCAVIGVPDEKWGEKVVAVVELKAGRSASADKLIDFCKSELGSIRSPKQVFFWEELPRSPVGKVLKKEIRKYFWKDSTRNV